MSKKELVFNCNAYLPMMSKLEEMKEQLDYLTSQRKPEPWMDKDEVMKFFRISSSTYYKWRSKGILEPSSSLGEDRYLVSDIQAILKKKKFK